MIKRMDSSAFVVPTTWIVKQLRYYSRCRKVDWITVCFKVVIQLLSNTDFQTAKKNKRKEKERKSIIIKSIKSKGECHRPQTPLQLHSIPSPAPKECPGCSPHSARVCNDQSDIDYEAVGFHSLVIHQLHVLRICHDI
jgi:hypothetical protein